MAVATPALAQVKNFDIPAQEATSGIAQLGRQADVQIGAARKDTRGKRTRAVRGQMSVEQALGQLLEGTGLRARPTGSQTFTVVRTVALSMAAPVKLASASAQPVVPPSEPAQADEVRADEPELDSEIVVTARKREETLSDVPAAITAFSGQDLESFGADDFDDYAIRVPGLGFSNLGAANIRGTGPSINIRGLPDTGYYIGETPIPHGQPEAGRHQSRRGAQGAAGNALRHQLDGRPRQDRAQYRRPARKLEMRGEATSPRPSMAAPITM